MIVGRDVPQRRVGRKFAGDAARAILSEAGFGKGREVMFLTSGQFSSVDWIDAILDHTGEADAVIATWTAAAADLGRVESWLTTVRLRSCSWIVDRSFPNRQPDICKSFRARFGDEGIRVFATHAKFCLLWNEKWKIVALTSANLNNNPRTEMFHAADDADLFGQFKEMVDDVFAAQEPGEGFLSDAGKRKPRDALKRKAITERAAVNGMKTAIEVGLK